MQDNEMDRILSGNDEIVPSSGFASRVMDAVLREASEPPPIAFPWKRALPGLAVWIAALVALFSSGRSVQSVATPPTVARFSASLMEILNSANRYGVGWILLALAVSAVSAVLPLWLTRRRVRA